MPTGYTAALHDGDQSFEDFAWGVARSFGALISMRDEPMDAPIPEEFQPSSYHQNGLEEARVDLEALRKRTDEEMARDLLGKRHEAEQYRARYLAERASRRARYEAMLDIAKAYEPPTPDHVEFKRTMVEQLEKSIEFDCGGNYAPSVPPLMTAQEYREELEAGLLASIERHKQELAKETERAEQRTAWVRALRDSITGVRA